MDIIAKAYSCYKMSLRLEEIMNEYFLQQDVRVCVDTVKDLSLCNVFGHHQLSDGGRRRQILT